jgi:transcriptional regulator with XRE-family HTH domain
MFYDIFSNLCQKRGIKPSRAAEECGINKSNVSNWKNNGYIPRGEALGKLATYFGVSVDYLLGNEQKEKPAQNVQVRDEHDNIVVLDDETRDLIDSLRKNPEMKMLFSVSKGATKEDIIKTIKIIEALKDRGEEGDD